MTRLGLLAALCTAVPLGAQSTTIRPGMSQAEVIAAFGPPTVTRQAGDWAYLFYANGCPVSCGSDDVVFLRNGQVVTAVLRTGQRRFAGAGVGALDGAAAPRSGMQTRVPGTARTRVSGRPARRIVVGPRDGAVSAPADGFRDPGATGDTIRGPLQRADTAAALSPPTPVPGTPPASGTPPRPQPPQTPSPKPR